MISYLTSTNRPQIFDEGMESDVRRKLDTAIQGLDQALPGTFAALEHSCPNFMYDPKGNYHRWIGNTEELITHSGYFRPQHAIYFSKSGLRKSIPHEIVHMLDTMAGSGSIILFSLTTLYPNRTLVDEANMSSFAKTLLGAITGARICLVNPGAAEFALQELASGGTGMPITQERQEINNFVAERFANLFEQFAFEKLSTAGAKPTYFAKSFYQAITMWEPEWLLAHDSELTALWNGMLTQIMSLSPEQIQQRVLSF